MIGIIICTHSRLASGLRDACEMLAGKQEKLDIVEFGGDEDLFSLSSRLREASENNMDGTIFLCDILNGTPFNACALTISGTEDVILSGVSLPMLIELVIKRNVEENCSDLADYIVESSQSYVDKKVSKDIFG